PMLPALALPVFPYTTLFRSSGRGQGRVVPVPLGFDLGPLGRGRVVVPRRARVRGSLTQGLAAGPVGRGGVAVPVGVGAARVEAEDRKSTRLNSSHVASSYAV